jgi:N-acetylglucosaminyl-diphospho-decaprenol L-rhamnosyltransferase
MLAPRVTAILVTYNSSHCVAAALTSLPAGVLRIVVDNGSVDDTVTLAERHGARVVKLGQNRGFSVGCNAGARIADTEYLLMMNPDTIAGEGAVAALVAGAERHPEAAGFNPHLERDGTGPQPNGDAALETLSGAALFVRKRLFDQIGGFDERFFLYFEDADLSARLAANGALLQIGAARFTHAIGRSSRLGLADEFRKYRHYGHSRVYFHTKYDRRFRRHREALAQGLKAIHRLVVGRTRHAAQHLGRAVGYLEGVRPR